MYHKLNIIINLLCNCHDCVQLITVMNQPSIYIYNLILESVDNLLDYHVCNILYVYIHTYTYKVHMRIMHHSRIPFQYTISYMYINVHDMYIKLPSGYD